MCTKSWYFGVQPDAGKGRDTAKDRDPAPQVEFLLTDALLLFANFVERSGSSRTLFLALLDCRFDLWTAFLFQMMIKQFHACSDLTGFENTVFNCYGFNRDNTYCLITSEK